MEEEPVRLFEEQALPHLVHSLEALRCLLWAVLAAGKRAGSELDTAGIQRQVELANKEAGLSADAAQDLSEKVDGRCEEATAAHGQASRQCRDQAAALHALQDKLQQQQSEREAASARLQADTLSLRQAEDALRSARAKAGEKETGRDVGIGLSFLLPCVGIAMAVAFEKERKLSELQVEVVSDDRARLSSSISQDEKLVSQIDSQRPELQQQAQGLEQQLQDSQAVEQELKARRRQLAETQARFRACCQFLSSFQGKLAALRVQSLNLYSLGPLLPFLEEAGLQGLLLPPEPLLNQPAVQRLLGDLKALLPQLKELGLSQDSSDYMK